MSRLRDTGTARSTNLAERGAAGSGGVVSDRDRVFVSYRRSDSEPAVAAVRLWFERHLDPDSVFVDTARIDLGDLFPDELHCELARSAAVLAVIGSGWFSAVDSSFRRRIDDPEDRVHKELAVALANPLVTVIPLLVGDTKMPTGAQSASAAEPAGRARRRARARRRIGLGPAAVARPPA